MRRRATFFLCTTLLALCALPLPRADAADHFLTIGGGYSPAGNQVSLERNVLFFRHVLTDLYPQSAPPHHVFFSDGDSPNRDIQFDDPAWDVPEAARLLAQLNDDEDDLGYRYRSHELKDVRGAATRAQIDRWFADTGSKLAAGDRLVLYVTGHGAAQESANGRKEYHNNKLHLWNGEHITVRELAGLLDKLPQGVNVVAVMVQCYSGGFADLMFEGGRSEGGAAKNGVRYGFFSTMPDRQAAGCTPDVNESNYQDYSSTFWAALRGKTRTGATVERSACDFDADGTVTFAEAHAYVLLHDDSIDVPMTTSDRFLRLHSDAGASGGRLVSAEDMHARINALAGPAQRAVIDGLTAQLALPGNGAYRYAAGKELSDSLREQHRDIERRENGLKKRLEKERDAIRETLELRWPELHNRWDPAVDRILREEADELVKAVKSHPRYNRFAKLYAEIGELSEKDDALEVRWAKCHRLMRAIERVALEHNLPLVADEGIVARFKALNAAENGTLGLVKR